MTLTGPGRPGDEIDLSDDRPKSRASVDQPVPVRTKLSALWASVMFLYVYVDIFSLYAPGTIDEILVGRVWEFDMIIRYAVSWRPHAG